jgi:hypothetical protein
LADLAWKLVAKDSEVFTVKSPDSVEPIIDHGMLDFLKKHAEDIKTLRVIYQNGGGLSSFVSMILYEVHKNGLPLDPEWALDILGSEVYEFYGRIEMAQEALRENPELPEKDIRAAAPGIYGGNAGKRAH